MSMYETGTVSAAADATTITGSGTKWADQRNGIGPQCTIAIYGAGTVDLYAIARVDSDTQLTVTRPVSKAFSGSAYGVMVAETQSVQYWSNMLASQLGYYQSQMDGWQEIMTGTGSVTITAPDEREVTISSFKKLTDDMAGKLDKNLVVGSVSGGAVIETGSNSNGRYIKYADGTMTCYGNYTNVTTSDSFGGSYYRASKFFTFPAAFSSSATPVIVPTANYVSGGVGWVHSTSAMGVSGVNVWYMCYQQGAIGSVNYIAIGRWK
jgi:hypothetical protein